MGESYRNIPDLKIEEKNFNFLKKNFIFKGKGMICKALLHPADSFVVYDRGRRYCPLLVLSGADDRRGEPGHWPDPGDEAFARHDDGA